MGRDAVGTEAVIEDGFHNDIVADDIVVHRKREIMPDYPSPVGCVEILGLGEVELGKGGDADGLHVSRAAARAVRRTLASCQS